MFVEIFCLCYVSETKVTYSNNYYQKEDKKETVKFALFLKYSGRKQKLNDQWTWEKCTSLAYTNVRSIVSLKAVKVFLPAKKIYLQGGNRNQYFLQIFGYFKMPAIYVCFHCYFILPNCFPYRQVYLVPIENKNCKRRCTKLMHEVPKKILNAFSRSILNVPEKK